MSCWSNYISSSGCALSRGDSRRHVWIYLVGLDHVLKSYCILMTFLSGYVSNKESDATGWLCRLIRVFTAHMLYISKTVSMIRKYHHKLQTSPWHREEGQHNNHERPGRQIKQSNTLSLPLKMIAKLDLTQSNTQQKIAQLQNP